MDNKGRVFSTVAAAVVVAFLLTASGCQALKEVANLRKVDFALDRVTEANLAGVDLSRIRSYGDLRTSDVLKVTSALANRELPLVFNLHLTAENPPQNTVQARLVQMDWTLFLEERETISGVLDQNLVLEPGQPADIAVPISLDLMRFFGDNMQDLIELALAVSGQGGSPKNIKLQATPTIHTIIGPIRYPQPIIIVNREVGS